MSKHSLVDRTVIIIIIVLLLLSPLGCGLPFSKKTKEPSTQPPGQQSDQEITDGTVTDKGTTRKDPIPLGTLAAVPGWYVQVLEFLRGEAALTILNTADWQVDPLPAGQEYAVAKVFVRCTSMDSNYHSLGISNIFITGSHNTTYGDTMDSWPQPEFLFEDMYTAEAVEGWIDVIIPTDEQNFMLVVDVPDADGNSFLRFFELETGASIPIPKEFANNKPNDLGVEVNKPAPIGQTVISPNWEVTLLSSLHGQEAETVLQANSSYYTPPESGKEYLVLNVKLRYISPDDIPGSISSYSFWEVDQTGNTRQADSVYYLDKPDRNWISEKIFPGAEIEGWVALIVDAGNVQSVSFHPTVSGWISSDEDLRYLALQ